LINFVLTDCRPGRTVWPELDRVVVCLLLGTGLRASELLGLNLGSRETSQGDVSVRVVGKGGKPRTVPTPPPLPALIDEYQESRAIRFGGWKPVLTHPLLVGPAPRSEGLATTQGYIDSVARDRQAAAAANPALRHMRVEANRRPDDPAGAPR